tara:strand:- start:862 stop:1269 length:408 start_codon:yes stop_codon:yes gene_type:complete
MRLLKTKRVIVVRKDLKMRKGKIAAQVSHASKLTFLNMATFDEQGFRVNYSSYGDHEEAFKNWIENIFTEIVVGVESEEEFDLIANKAKEKELPVFVVTDIGKTEFNGVPTKTVLSIGPADETCFDGVTDGLKLI